MLRQIASGMELIAFVFVIVVLAAAILAGVFAARAVFRKLSFSEAGRWAVAVAVFIGVGCIVVLFGVGGCALLFVA